MSTSPFEFTPEQKAVLEQLSQKTGEDICSLITRALAKLQEEEQDETAFNKACAILLAAITTKSGKHP